MTFIPNFVVGPALLTATYLGVTFFHGRPSVPASYDFVILVLTVLFFVGAVLLGVTSSDALIGKYRSYTAWLGKPEYRLYVFRHIGGSVFCAMLGFSSLYLLLSSYTEKAFNAQLNPVSALYFSVVTFATVGYGDIVATSSPAQLLVSSEVVVSMGYFVFIFSLIAGHMQKPDNKPVGD